MTAADFRRVALGFPEATESAHMDHPDFRVRGKIFATLGYPDTGVGMVKLFPDQQREFVRDEPKVFVPVNGAAKKRSVQRALAPAWRNTAPRKLVAQYEGSASSGGARRG